MRRLQLLLGSIGLVALAASAQAVPVYYTFAGTVGSVDDFSTAGPEATFGGFTAGESTVEWTFVIDTGRPATYSWRGTLFGPYPAPFFYSELQSGAALATTGADPSRSTSVTFGATQTVLGGFAYGSAYPGMNPNYVLVRFDPLSLSDLTVGQTGFRGESFVDDRYGEGASGLWGQFSLDDMELTRIEAPEAIPEPATLLILGSGLVVLARFRRRLDVQGRGRRVQRFGRASGRGGGI